MFTIDLNETFPKLANPPIVEAVIHWQAKPQNPFDSASLTAALADEFAAYPRREPIHWVDLQATFSDSSQENPAIASNRDWHGTRLTSEDGRFVIQFTRDGLVFSQVDQYASWEPFVEAALEAWKIFVRLAQPIDTQRLGIRYINQMKEATHETLDDFLCEPPTRPLGLPLKEFIYQSTLSVPGENMSVRVIKLIQPAMGIESSSGLFLDLDVFTTKPIPIDSKTMMKLLARMRWLKNKVFFALITDNARAGFEGK